MNTPITKTAASALVAGWSVALEKPVAELLRDYSVQELRERTAVFLKRLRLVKK